METTRCQSDREHTGVWTCACANGGNFCSHCILDHMGVDSGQQHAVAPLGPIGQYVCGRCHGQPLESIRFKYDVCLCTHCASNLTITSPAGQAFPGIEVQEQREGDAKQRAEAPPGFPREEQVKRMAEGGRTMLQRLIAEKRNDITQSLRRAYDNMNSLEEVIQEALSLETQLNDSRLEVQRLQGRLVEQGGGGRAEVGQMAGIQQFMEKIEVVSRENEALKAQNNFFDAQLAELKAKLQAAETEIVELKERPQSGSQVDEAQMKTLLKEQLDEAVTMLQESIREQVADSAKVVAQKVTDVIPLISHIELDNTWLDRCGKSLECVCRSPNSSDPTDSSECSLTTWEDD